MKKENILLGAYVFDAGKFGERVADRILRSTLKEQRIKDKREIEQIKDDIKKKVWERGKGETND